MSSMMNMKTATLILAALTASPFALGDTLDWVNPAWLLSNQAQSDPNMAAARKQIVGSAGSRSKEGPYSVTSSPVLPVSGNPHDYLSWAPYHWPDCNWCSTKQQKAYIDADNATEDTTAEDYFQTFELPTGETSSPLYIYASTPSSSNSNMTANASRSSNEKRATKTKPSSCTPSPTKSLAPSATWTTCPYVSRDGKRNPDVDDIPDAGYLNDMPLAVLYNAFAYSFNGAPTVTNAKKGGKTKANAGPVSGPVPDVPAGTAPANASIPSSAPASTSTPASPSGGLPNVPDPMDDPLSPTPSTTEDGGFSSGDNGSSDPETAPQYSANAKGGKSSPNTPTSTSNPYVTKAISYIDTFFLNPRTSMTPNLQYGQLIRGPGEEHQQGQYMGIVDARGFVSVWNTVVLLRAAGANEWSAARDKAMSDWASKYLSWLTGSGLGQKAGMAANNHGTFWMVQVAALKYMLGDYAGVRNTINYFVTHQFQDQIAASGEQPFEAVRTRPFHYRAFNLEALITLAKLGDQVGINMWAAQSRYHGTIQTALDFAMQGSPGSESIQALLPHVASVAVAYGDPSGKYANFIDAKDDGKERRTWWWHDVPGAFGPKSNIPHQRKRDDEYSTANATGIVWAPGDEPIRPEVFGVDGLDEVQLDDGVFVTWDELRPYYTTLQPLDDVANRTTAEAQSAEEEVVGSDEEKRSIRRRSRGPARIRVW